MNSLTISLPQYVLTAQGLTALDYAVQQHHRDITALLVGEGASMRKTSLQVFKNTDGILQETNP